MDTVGIDSDQVDFNPRSPWGERRRTCLTHGCYAIFQSTLPVGGATKKTRHRISAGRFQSTLPVGGATRKDGGQGNVPPISIHAPRGGSDITFDKRRKSLGNFNPRSPWGERRLSPRNLRSRFRFQSTLPVGGATASSLRRRTSQKFQSTLPVGGATLPALV